ncbi:MAG: DUF1254 domain-containing protein [Usitatibacteraceae bacterium]
MISHSAWTKTNLTDAPVRALTAVLLLAMASGTVTRASAQGSPASPNAIGAEQKSAKAIEEPRFDWREQNAYALGVQAYIYCFPWAYMPEARWTRSESANRQANRFAHIRKLEDASKTSGGAPNNDTLYSRAWLYLKDEPMILSVPEIRNRYYTMELVDFMGDNFDYVGVRATGTAAGNYAIVGPGWKGKLPAGIKRLKPSSTPWAFIMGRTFVQDESDIAAVHAIQDQYKLTPLSQWGKPAAKQSDSGRIWKPLDPKDDSLAAWKTINRALTEVPPDARDADLMQSFTRIGIGPGLDIDTRDASTKRGLIRAAIDAQKIIGDAIVTGHLQKNVNGWNYPPPAIGRPTPTRDWLFRAMQMQAGFVANDPEEAVYLNVGLDAERKPLSGQNRYVIRFKPGAQPAVKAFWSVTMYNPRFNLVANSINRYALGDRSGMKPDADGGVTLYLQKNSPGADQESNWLPTPEGRFFLIMRAYLPGDDVVKQSWQPPLITRLQSE